MDQNNKKKIMIFCTCTEYNKEFYLHRASNWFHNLKYIDKVKELDPDFYIFNDGKITYEDIKTADSSLLSEDHLYIKNHEPMLGRLSDLSFPGWIRSFKHALEIGLEKYDCIIHIESDVLLLHPDKIVSYFDKPGMFCSHWKGRDICDSTLLIMNDKEQTQKIYNRMKAVPDSESLLVEGTITPLANWQFVFNGGRLEDDANNLTMDLDFISQLYTSKSVNPESLVFKNAHDIFIFVANDNGVDRYMLPKNRYVPVQCMARASKKIEGIIHDDDLEDNISKKTNIYGQLTALYYIWKHYKPMSEDTVVGFYTHDMWLTNQAAILPSVTRNGNSLIYLCNDLLTTPMDTDFATLNSPFFEFQRYDVFLAKRQHLIVGGNGSSLITRMSMEYGIDFYRTLEKVICEKHFDYGHKIWKDYGMDELIPFPYRLCFVMKYKHFKDFCELLFTVLSEIEEAYKDKPEEMFKVYKPLDVGKPALFEKLAVYILGLYIYKNKLVVKDQSVIYRTEDSGVYVQPYSS